MPHASTSLSLTHPRGTTASRARARRPRRQRSARRAGGPCRREGWLRRLWGGGAGPLAAAAGGECGQRPRLAASVRTSLARDAATTSESAVLKFLSLTHPRTAAGAKAGDGATLVSPSPQRRQLRRRLGRAHGVVACTIVGALPDDAERRGRGRGRGTPRSLRRDRVDRRPARRGPPAPPQQGAIVAGGVQRVFHDVCRHGADARRRVVRHPVPRRGQRPRRAAVAWRDRVRHGDMGEGGQGGEGEGESARARAAHAGTAPPPWRVPCVGRCTRDDRAGIGGRGARGRAGAPPPRVWARRCAPSPPTITPTAAPGATYAKLPGGSAASPGQARRWLGARPGAGIRAQRASRAAAPARRCAPCPLKIAHRRST